MNPCWTAFVATSRALPRGGDRLRQRGGGGGHTHPTHGCALHFIGPEGLSLTARSAEARRHGFALLAEIDQRRAERYGADRIAAIREGLEALTVGELPLPRPRGWSPSNPTRSPAPPNPRTR